MGNDKIMEVSAIKEGTVIDHIPSAALFPIIRILGLEHSAYRMTIGFNLESRCMGRKGIIKIADRTCLDREINRIAILAPEAIVNTIHDYRVVEKRQVTVPARIEGFVRCTNPKCITNHEPVATDFDVEQGPEGMMLRCRYCEKVTPRSRMELIG